MKRAVACITVSTQEQAAEGVSLDNPEEADRSLLFLQGIPSREIVEDAGVSGGLNKARQGSVELLEVGGWRHQGKRPLLA